MTGMATPFDALVLFAGLAAPAIVGAVRSWRRDLLDLRRHEAERAALRRIS